MFTQTQVFENFQFKAIKRSTLILVLNTGKILTAIIKTVLCFKAKLCLGLQTLLKL